MSRSWPLIVFDIDGTLADCTHRLHLINSSPKRWNDFFDSCWMDEPIPAGVAMARLIHGSEKYDIEFWTGRPERSRLATEEWLSDHLGPWTQGYPIEMRRNKDQRADTVVKAEFIDPHAPPFIIFEDRRQVVAMYRKRGLTVYQVSQGDY